MSLPSDPFFLFFFFFFFCFFVGGILFLKQVPGEGLLFASGILASEVLPNSIDASPKPSGPFSFLFCFPFTFSPARNPAPEPIESSSGFEWAARAVPSPQSRVHSFFPLPESVPCPAMRIISLKFFCSLLRVPLFLFLSMASIRTRSIEGALVRKLTSRPLPFFRRFLFRPRPPFPGKN